MTISQPSREIYVVDVPEVRDLSAVFHYNFFVADESTNALGGIPAKILLRSASDIDSEFVQFATTRAPRVVTFSFSPPKLSDVGREVTNENERTNVFETLQTKNIIASNLDKIVSEDDFSSYNFISVAFHDGNLQEKIHYLVSGSFEQHTLDDEASDDASHYKAANKLSELVPNYIDPEFLSRAMVSPSISHGTSFYSTSDSSGKPSIASSTMHRHVRHEISKVGREKTMKYSTYNARLNHVTVHAQINGKLFHNVVDRTLKDPNSSAGPDLHELYKYSRQVQTTTKHRSLLVNERDYKSFVPFIDLRVGRASHITNRQPCTLVGFIIDKIESTPAGEMVVHPPIIVENPRASMTADFCVKYGSTYSYAIRSIAKFTLPAIDDDTGDIATLQVLVSSRPSNHVYVKTVEQVAPPPPSDLNFTWDYERDKLMVHWTFPPNSQRDIKKFQVFRRENIDNAFELIKMYDFDDSLVRYKSSENPNPSLVEYLTSPATFYVDDDFVRSSKFIYSTACIDAHGMTSCYSAQYEVWFDQFQNKLQKKLVSHSGAPKPYPNMYLEADTFVDTIRVDGPHSRKMSVYFNPEYYHLIDDDDRVIDVVTTKQKGGEYKLQLINLDNQRSQTLTISIDDRILKSGPTVKSNMSFGPARRSWHDL